ncbi:MAG: 1-(5-phosphoribosyl)-5-[(5-phosphoribosylamino)methylideneamino]imidazole-4-carboxamide isomerase [Bacteroidaceae bacterium]|nr:1-(5-phosphoribosyl)-5-[(5-phosphoribosylamino)methylideneamino]imidazole-4-carboxamide isomerase [Bacteroidaceae bacterium]
MIEIIPAIDMIEGKCVRLTKGDYAQKKVYNDSPLEVAKMFESMGIRRLHLVDLDGAKSKHVVNDKVLRDICRETRLVVDFGGGIKSEADLEKVFDAGAAIATAGSIAATDRETVYSWIERYGADRLVLGADVREGKISINGWQEDSDIDLMTFLEDYLSRGIRNVLCTDISKDGMLQGPNIDLYRSIMKRFPQCHLIASGGVSSNDDIKALDGAGIPAVVFGKAFYEGRINIEELKN